MKLTKKASVPYFSNPASSRNVSFSKNPSMAARIANRYTIIPVKTCHGSELRRKFGSAPGKKKHANPNIHCTRQEQIDRLHLLLIRINHTHTTENYNFYGGQ